MFLKHKRNGTYFNNNMTSKPSNCDQDQEIKTHQPTCPSKTNQPTDQLTQTCASCQQSFQVREDPVEEEENDNKFNNAEMEEAFGNIYDQVSGCQSDIGEYELEKWKAFQLEQWRRLCLPCWRKQLDKYQCFAKTQLGHTVSKLLANCWSNCELRHILMKKTLSYPFICG